MKLRDFKFAGPSAIKLSSSVVILSILIALGSAQAADAPSPYASWIKPWTERPATSPALDGKDLKCVITLITGESDANAISSMTPAQRLALAYQIQVAATEIAVNGSCRDYFVSNTSTKSGPVRQLAPANFERLIAGLSKLPADEGKLPAAGRRVVVQIRENGQWHVSVYDGRQLPPEVKALVDQLANPYFELL